MADADRAIPLHQQGATPTNNRSVPVDLLMPADAIPVEAGDDGLDEGTVQETMQALASRLQALEDA
jgi:hypothetical protein